SAFGTMLLVLSALSALAAFGFSRSGVISLGVTGALAYLAACIAMPPSLMKFIRIAAESHGEAWTVATLTSIAFLGLVWTLLLPWLHRHVRDLHLRFFVLFTLSSLLIVWMFQFLGRSIIPQPGRYKVELSLGLAVSCVFALRPLWKRCTRPVQLAILALLVTLAAEQTVDQRHWAKAVLREGNLAETIEHRAAVWMDAHLDPDARVMLPGSMAQWLNAFSRRPQWGGGAWSTAPNPELQRALRVVFEEQGSIEGSLTWFRAFAVQGVVISGNHSPEFWKPFADKTKYEGKLPVLWHEDDTSLYGLPLHSKSLAHAVPEAVRSTRQWTSVKRYVAALDTERLPGLTFKWAGRNRAQINGEVLPGEAVSIQITHHPGWSATVNGKPVPLQRDGIGLVWLRPSCNGPCAIQLSYNGGIELILCRIVSLVALACLSVLLVWGCRTDVGIRFL
ncbi:MAG TPA: hypothetical protein VNH18_31420, partial [Bryobacteraceae bacterium]|nr:hypothetical protein [Bryobacteraceae bacterium]